MSARRHLPRLVLPLGLLAPPAMAQPAPWSMVLDARAAGRPAMLLRVTGEGARIVVAIGRGPQRIELVTEGPGAGQPDSPRPRLADLDGDGRPDLLLPSVLAMRHEQWQVWLQAPGGRFVEAGTVEVGLGESIRRDRWGYIVAGTASGGVWTGTLYAISRQRQLVPAHSLIRPTAEGPGAQPCAAARLPGATRDLPDAAFRAHCRP